VNALNVIGALLVAGLLGVLAVVALAPGSAPTANDTLLVGLSEEPRSLDPHTTTASSDFRVAVNLYEGLTRFETGTLTPGPGLAKRWKVSNEGKQYTFFLRRGVRFHDGTPFDARAVKFNFDRMLDKRHPYHHTGPFPLAFFFEQVKSVDVVDSHTVRFTLDEPFAPLLANLAYPTGMLVSPAAVIRYQKEFGRHPVGTGPFRFARWDAGQRVVLARNEQYHQGAPVLRRVIFRPVADPMTRVAELRASGLDLVPELSPDNARWFRDAPGFHVAEAAGPHLWFLILNTNKAPFNDVRVRRAVNLAVDKQALVNDVLQETASVAAGPIAKAFGAHAGEVVPYPHDPARARQLLAEAGVEAGQRLAFAAPESGSGMLAPMQMATAIQADLERIGFDVEIESYEWNSYLTLVNAGLERFDMAAMAWMTSDPDTLPFLALRSRALPPKGFNSGWYRNPALDELLVAARGESDPRARAAIYARVQRIVHDDAPWLFVASWKQNVVAQSAVQGLKLEPSFQLHLEGVHKQ
jgi:peptide/nickel transport system substrate-binding protein